MQLNDVMLIRNATPEYQEQFIKEFTDEISCQHHPEVRLTHLKRIFYNTNRAVPDKMSFPGKIMFVIKPISKLKGVFFVNALIILSAPEGIYLL